MSADTELLGGSGTCHRAGGATLHSTREQIAALKPAAAPGAAPAAAAPAPTSATAPAPATVAPDASAVPPPFAEAADVQVDDLIIV